MNLALETITKMNYYTLLVLLAIGHAVVGQEETPTVVGHVYAETTLGTIKGSQIKVADQLINTYFGIPYAAPPVDDLRFHSPKSRESWEGVLDGTVQPNCCIQPVENLLGHTLQGDPRISEDCLYLNLWTPMAETSGGPLPIVIVIHGGGFSMGCVNMKIYDGLIMAALSNVIVVTINYRLGALGFLNLDIGDVSGNMGLMDQQMAIKWVHSNAHLFGGDASQIMLLGDSTGGASVAYQILSEGTKGFFSRAFIQSGNILSSLAFMPNHVLISHSKIFSKLKNCNSLDATAILRCLKTRSAIDLSIETDTRTLFGPNVDGVFIKSDPKTLIEEDKVPGDISLISGLTKDEGSLFVAAGFLPCSREVVSNNVTDSIMFRCVKAFLRILPDDLVQNVIKHYTENNEPSLDINRDAIVKLVGDIMFVCPAREFTRLYSRPERMVFSYVFTHLVENATVLDNEWMGVVHGSDFSMVLGDHLYKSPFNSANKFMSLKMMNLISSFARTGIPISDIKEPWPVYLNSNKKYVEFDQHDTIKRDFHGENCEFLQQAYFSLSPPPSV